MLYITPSNRKATIIKRAINHLKLKTKGELFVLKCLVELHQVSFMMVCLGCIKLENGLIKVKFTTMHKSYDFTVSDIESKGFRKDIDDYGKQSYIKSDISHKTLII